jgi:hypothetical protein
MIYPGAAQWQAPLRLRLFPPTRYRPTPAGRLQLAPAKPRFLVLDARYLWTAAYFGEWAVRRDVTIADLDDEIQKSFGPYRG